MTTAAPDLADSYQHDGLVQVSGVFDESEIQLIVDVFMTQAARDNALAYDDGVPDDDPLARFPRFVHPHRHPETDAGRLALGLMFDSRIIDVVHRLIGPALGAQSMFYFKPPGARGQALHQDNLFLRAHPETCVAAWIAVDPADEENGGLAVVPGSHRTDLTCPEPADLTESFTNAEVRIPDGLSKVQTRLAAGDVLFFHGSMVHGSRPNSSASRFRRSLIFHYVPETSTEVSAFYNPLVRPAGDPVSVADARGGGPCGDIPTEP